VSAAPYAQRLSRPVGWWGIAIFVGSEAMVFGALLVTYFHQRIRNNPWPPHGVPDPKVAVPLFLTGVLVSTSIAMQYAFARSKDGHVVDARFALLIALTLQVTYLALQLHLFVDDLDKFSPSATSYGSIYYTLVGAHHAHVFVGILLTAWLFLRFMRGITPYRLVGLEATTWYWHFVNVLAVVVTLVQVSPSL
jgi:heme/copper-type cytochrome/quinol oxidase subunit 3